MPHCGEQGEEAQVEGKAARALQLLDRMVACETVFGRPNLDPVQFVDCQLTVEDILSRGRYGETTGLAKLHAMIGPAAESAAVRTCLSR